MKRMSLVLAALAVPMVSACTSIGHGGLATTSPSAGPRAQLTQSHACATIAGFTCSTLTVPLDHNGHTPGTLRLQVAAADAAGRSHADPGG